MEQKVNAIIQRYSGDKSYLVPILQDVQKEFNYLPKDALCAVSTGLNVSISRVYEVATFYKAFSLVPKGEHSISVCLGTACQVRNAPLLLDRIVEVFKVKPGQTSADMKFSLDTVNCLGCCALGPVMLIDDQYYSKPTKEELERLAAAE